MKTLRLPRAPGWWAECREKTRHLRLRGAVGAYADGELTGADRMRMAAHLARCWSCSGTLQTLKLIKASLRRSPGQAPVSLASVRLRRYAVRLAAVPATSPRHRARLDDDTDPG